MNRWQTWLAGFLVGLAVMAGWLHAEHTASLAWMAPYKSADGVGCCSALDCRPVPVALLAHDAETATVLVRGVLLVLPSRSVHLSEDEHAYWCFRADREPPIPTALETRCVFLSVGG